MQKYDDMTNAKGVYLIFIVLQVSMLLIVYSFVYTSLIAVKLAIETLGLTFMAYMPVVLALIGYPVVLYKTRKIFLQGKGIRAAGWVMGWASFIISGLYFYLSEITGV
ncbi:MAG: hypothetical protein ABXS92_03950 [Sulfurimonas sp.]